MINELLFARPSRVACAVALVLAAALSPIFANAASSTSSVRSPDALYQHERADCLSGRSPQSQTSCLREAGAARDAARKGLLTTETPQVLHDNQQQRCLAQPEGAERTACDRMARGEGTVTGSVAAGGQLRELKIIVPAEEKPKRARPIDGAAPSGP